MQRSRASPGTPLSAADSRAYDVSTQAMQMLLQHLPGMVYRCQNDREWTMKFVTAGAYRLTGYPVEDLLSGRVPYGRIIHPDDRDAVWDGVQAALAEHRRYELTYRLRCADGREKWVWEQGRGVFDERGELLTLEGLILDITAQKNNEEERRRYRAELEALVAQRTQELERVNAQLQAELAGRARVTEALRVSEQRYRSIVESQAELISRFGSDLVLTFVNAACARCFGGRPEELIGRPLLERVPPDAHDAIRAQLLQLRPGGPPAVVEHPICLPDGTQRWTRWTNRALADEHGHLLEYQGVGWDITEQRRAEELVRLQRDLDIELAAACDLPSAMQRLLALAGRIEGVDGGGVYALSDDGRALELVAHRNLSSDFVAAAKRFTLDTAEGRVVLAGQPVYWRLDKIPLERTLLEREGLRSVAVLPTQFDGKVVGSLNLGSRTCGAFDGATRAALEAIAARIGALVIRVRTESALRASEHTFRTLAETVAACIVIVQDGAFRYVNSATSTLLACSREEVLRTPPWEFVHPDMRALMKARILGRVRGEAQPPRYELRLVGRDGREHWMDISVGNIDYEGRPAALGVALEISERKLAEESERHHREQLAHAARLSTLGEMASGLAHELAQPLSAILYFARGAAARVHRGEMSPAESGAAFEKIAAQAARAGEFIRHVKAFVHKGEPLRVPDDLNRIVRETLGFFAPELRAQHPARMRTPTASAAGLRGRDPDRAGPAEPAPQRPGGCATVAARAAPRHCPHLHRPRRRLCQRAGLWARHRTRGGCPAVRAVFHHQAGRHRPRSSHQPHDHRRWARRSDVGGARPAPGSRMRLHPAARPRGPA